MSSSFPHVGYLGAHLGPMFAGKTTKATYKATCMAFDGNKVLYVNHIKDSERKTIGGHDGKFNSHNSSNIYLSNDVDTIMVSSLNEIDIGGYQVIIVDEIQFFDDALETIPRWVKSEKLHVEIYGLDTTFKQTPFGHSLTLAGMADFYEKLLAQCSICREEFKNRDFPGVVPQFPAPFTILRPGVHLSKDSSIIQPGTEIFIAVCRFHLEQAQDSSGENSECESLTIS